MFCCTGQTFGCMFNQNKDKEMANALTMLLLIDEGKCCMYSVK